MSMRPEGELTRLLREWEISARSTGSFDSTATLRFDDVALLNRMVSDWESAICWGVDCLHTAAQLDSNIQEYERGYDAGYLAGVASTPSP